MTDKCKTCLWWGYPNPIAAIVEKINGELVENDNFQICHIHECLTHEIGYCSAYKEDEK